MASSLDDLLERSERGELMMTLEAGLKELGIGLNHLQCQRLIDFLAILKKWNLTHNLTSNDDWSTMLTHHLMDSLAILPCVDDELRLKDPCGNGLIVDVGSGAGLPGLAIAIARPDYFVVLIDAVRKKTVFLSYVVSALKLRNVICVHRRVEETNASIWKKFSDRESADLIVSRAFAVQSMLIQLSGHLLKNTGSVLAMRGKIEGVAQQEWVHGWHLKRRVPLFIPGLYAERHLNVWQPDLMSTNENL